MKMQLYNFENDIIFSDETINILEIENKKTFVKIVESLNNIANGLEPKEKICFYVDNEEINLFNKTICFFDIFNIDFNNKRYITHIYNCLAKNINENDIINSEIHDLGIKIVDNIKTIFSDFDIELECNEEIELDDIFKSLKIRINTKNNSIYDSLLTLIDLESTIHVNKILIFINLKDYLSNEQLIEFYKYSKYKKVNILLIESRSSGITLEYEKKLIIDSNYDEFVFSYK